uniref:Zinc finger protein 26 n=2 Tax=Cacopsylla melanoneura TaxID=428564 RepID=A0A8D8SRH1_9HEMI
MVTNRALQVHFRTVHQLKNPDRSTFDCCFCSELFHLKKDYHQHLTEVHGQKVSNRYRFQLCACSECGKMFYNAATLRTHVKMVHSTELLFECHLCDKTFRTKKYLRQHIPRHDVKSPRTARTRSQSDTSVDKPFNCNHCGNSYETVHQLAGHRVNCAFYLLKPDQGQHTKTSSNENFTIVSKECKPVTKLEKDKGPPFKCPHCDKSYSKKFSLTMHNLNKHDPSKKRVPTACTICGKTVINMFVHMRNIHDQPERRPYMCDICGASFKTTSALHTHQPIHTGERHLCPICGRGFTQRGDMRKHVRALHDEVIASLSAEPLQNEDEKYVLE